MNARSWLVCFHFTIVAALLAGCTDSPSGDGDNAVDQEVQKAILESEAHDDALLSAAIDGIKLHDEYTPTNFASKQHAYIDKLRPDLRDPAREYLPKRAAQVSQTQASNIVQPIPEKSELSKTKLEDAVRVQIVIEARNQRQARGKTHEPERVVYLVHLRVYDLDRIFYESVAKKSADSVPQKRL